MKKKNKSVIAFALYMLIGGAGGFFMASYVKDNDRSFLQLLYIFVWLVVSYMAGIIVHESGHLVMGSLTGYEFVSFRVGSSAWIKENGKLKRKKFSIAGTAGQCIMMPPETDSPESVPFLLYFLGGGLFNLLTAAVFIPLGSLLPGFYLSIPFFVFGAVSLVLGLLNLIPMDLTVQNDGYQICVYSRHKAERIMFYKHLRINGLLYSGKTPSEIPEEMFDFGEVSRGLPELLKASLCIDRKDFVQAEELIVSAIDSGGLASLFVLEARSELLFCKIMNGAPEAEIEELYDKELRRYITSAAKTQIAKRRILFAYQLIFKLDPEAAQKEYDAAMAMKSTYPSAGELRSELAVIEYVNDSFYTRVTEEIT